jgi:hypothetical protein
MTSPNLFYPLARLARFLLLSGHFPGRLLRLSFHLPALCLFCGPLCQNLWRERDVSTGIIDRRIRQGISPDATAGDGLRVPGRSSPASRTTTPLSGLSRDPDAFAHIPGQQTFAVATVLQRHKRASSLPMMRPSPPITCRRPSLSVSGLSQMPASFPFLSNAGSATCGCGYFCPVK